MPPLHIPKYTWKQIFYSLILIFFVSGYSNAASIEDPELFKKQIESGKSLLMEKNGAAARLNFKKAWDNASFTEDQRNTAQSLYYKAKNLEPYFTLLKEASGHISSKDYRRAVDVLESSEKHLFSSSTRFPDETLDTFFAEELETLITNAEDQRKSVVTDSWNKAEELLETDPAQSLSILEGIDAQMVDEELSKYNIAKQVEQAKKQIKYKDFFDQGNAAMAKKEYDEAREFFFKGWKINSTREIYQMIQEAEQKSCLGAVEQSKREMELQNYEYALELLEGSANCIELTELESLQKKAMEALYTEYLVKGSKDLEQENFQTAWATLKKAKQNKNTPEVTALISKAEKGAKFENYTQDGIAYEDEGNYQEAYDSYKEAYDQLQDPDGKVRLEEVKSILDRTNEKIKLAEDALKDEKFELARTHLLAGQRIYPKNGKIKQLLLDIEEQLRIKDKDSR